MNELKKPHILVCNDDGIEGEGIHVLAASMKKIGRVTVVAPAEPHSGMSHAMTLGVPLRIKEYQRNNRFFGYTVSGTPVDCIKVALSHILDDKPDILVSGINYGSNTATNTLYSGTVAAALEGAIQGITSLAFSLATYEHADFTYAGKFARKLAKKVLQQGIPADTILSVNIPNVPESEIAGVLSTSQGRSRWEENAIERNDMYGNPYYWLNGTLKLLDDSLRQDEYAVRRNYVTVTPLSCDLTNHTFLDSLNQWNLQK
ncbi:MAG: 5'/3'-nucleotidase SurE [Chlorobium limicola]|uniref:5'-nucleotidase SurE n=1 Tax=Chlorobium limicola (strain DSM 245 / NBRC 103803 / 6330) TaxID=290315 RepID=SURE_CHLL2|nr:5'/3'-nucleotidase SurE [Chlorobium limicola]B3EFW1.1 RecName: Full=5'-nucleotidase SurE; AltName: Full=Nucleoside 5'-monophosphate phosphohydrolase [Chlorobium limicola DSM 245]ACD89494.1 stationary-phase survival protein SurE [Chlorobium limicola DSM 245]NTV08222.1 5'/3'-nucleotidase SurE [Chlorobium limicola]NTV21415.1 5'/3'-nucleotidase SurE [Chlorobium limicola]